METKKKALGMGLEQLFNGDNIDIASFEKNCEQDIPATAFLWGYDSMGRPVDTLNPGYKNAQKALTKIEALTGLSLKNHKDLFTLELCLMITSPHLDTL